MAPLVLATIQFKWRPPGEPPILSNSAMTTQRIPLTPIQKSINLKADLGRKAPPPTKIITNFEFLHQKEYSVSAEERTAYPRIATILIKMMTPQVEKLRLPLPSPEPNLLMVDSAETKIASPGILCYSPILSAAEPELSPVLESVKEEEEEIIYEMQERYKQILANLNRVNRWAETQLPSPNSTRQDRVNAAFDFLIEQLIAPGEISPSHRRSIAVPARTDSLLRNGRISSGYDTLPKKLDSATISNSSTKAPTEFFSASRILKALSNRNPLSNPTSPKNFNTDSMKRY